MRISDFGLLQQMQGDSLNPYPQSAIRNLQSPRPARYRRRF
jgi:hypothetical protein